MIIDYLPIGRTLRFRLELAQQRRSQARVARGYDKDLSAAFARKDSHDDIQSIDTAASWEFSNAEEDIHKLQTRYYLAVARDMLLDVKIEESDWVDRLETGGRSLQVAAIAKLRQEIRRERSEQRQAWLAFLPVLSFLAALIAAVTGMITVLHKSPAPSAMILQIPPQTPSSK